jgi:predicted nucleic acid-binding protein
LLVWGRLMAQGPQNALDTIIAAVAEANDGIVVTDNERDLSYRLSTMWVA